MTASELSMGINALANLIACKLDDEELTVVASLVNQLGDNLTRISIDRALLNKLSKVKKSRRKNISAAEIAEEIAEEIG